MSQMLDEMVAVAATLSVHGVMGLAIEPRQAADLAALVHGWAVSQGAAEGQPVAPLVPPPAVPVPPNVIFVEFPRHG